MHKIIQGNNIDTLKQYPDNYFDSIVTDPPYGIDFLQKDWDSNTGAVETWEQCFRVLKPGGYILAFSAARTYHNLATNIEGVGFEIRDQIMWLYASGFPKAQDVGKAIQKRQGVEQSKPHKWASKQSDIQTDNELTMVMNKAEETICTSPEAQQWAGWKTALKPAHEPIVMARKPFKGSCVDNVLTHGVGALNIDATRIGAEEMPIGAHQQTPSLFDSNKKSAFAEETVQGRFPSNVLGEVTDYQKFFYCPKVNRAERHIGFEAPEPEPFNNPEDMKKHPLWDPSIGTNSHRLMTKIREHQKNNPLAHIPTNPEGMLDSHYNDKHEGKGYNAVREELVKTGAGNNHPTVKPVALMKYLVKLVTPAGGKVLDPFTGSGSTGMAAVELDYDFTGCELDPDYVDIANKRITAWKNKTDLNNKPLPPQWFEEL